MGRLIYSSIASLDGFVNDEAGEFAWSAPDEEVHAYVNDLARPLGTHLLGRRTYEVMEAWETMPIGPDEPPEMDDFARLWRAADKVVFSTTMAAPTAPRTTLMRTFDPPAVRALVEAADRDVSIGGPHLAAEALRAGLVDELQLFAQPVVVGGGTHWLPKGVRLELTLVDERRFAAGTVLSRYVPRR